MQKDNHMSSVRSYGNKSTELKLIEIFSQRNLFGWIRGSSLLGKPDFLFKDARIALFVDGCFWHGCPKHCRLPQKNIEYWDKKIKGNILRDKFVSSELKKEGWTVIRIWEHELKGCATLSRKLKKIINILENPLQKLIML